MKKQVSGTIMLHLDNGSKCFLVHNVGTGKEFAKTTAEPGKTVLASFLNFLKEKMHVDVNEISLVELTNTQSAGVSLPLYVFEATEKVHIELPDDYAWEAPESVREILGTVQIEGVPLF